MVQNSHRLMEASDVIAMFPTFVWKVQIESDLRDALRETVLAAIAEMRVRLAPPAPGEGWQSGQALYQHEEFRDLVACINDGVARHVAALRERGRTQVHGHLLARCRGR
jgi:hypothetical protein